MSNTENTKVRRSAIEVTHEVTINHRELGRSAWEWTDDEQAKFLTGFAEVFKADAGEGVMQIHFIADKLRSGEGNLTAVRWLIEQLTEYLTDPS